jgi:PPOX class probable F420-dependent enzyme
MSPDEVRAFLLQGTRTGKLGVAMRDGQPHVMPIWFVLDGDDVLFTTHVNTVKGRWITGDGRLSLCVDEELAPYAFVHLRGRATYSEDFEEMRRFATLIGGRYMGEERAEEFGRRNAVAGELLVRLTPERVIAESGVAD